MSSTRVVSLGAVVGFLLGVLGAAFPLDRACSLG